MSNRIEVPAGKKLIFRKSRRDPRTGRIQYAGPGKVFPILVDLVDPDEGGRNPEDNS